MFSFRSVVTLTLVNVQIDLTNKYVKNTLFPCKQRQALSGSVSIHRHNCIQQFAKLNQFVNKDSKMKSYMQHTKEPKAAVYWPSDPQLSDASPVRSSTACQAQPRVCHLTSIVPALPPAAAIARCLRQILKVDEVLSRYYILLCQRARHVCVQVNAELSLPRVHRCGPHKSTLTAWDTETEEEGRCWEWLPHCDLSSPFCDRSTTEGTAEWTGVAHKHTDSHISHTQKWKAE